MRKQDVINLINFGILHVSAHELGPEHSYKVFHMKRTFELANKAISDEQDAILKDAGIDDTFRQKAADINKKLLNKEALSIEEREWLDKANSMQQNVDKLLREMLKADIEIPALKAIPYEVWRELQKENKSKTINDRVVDILGGPAEILLAEIFWKAPEEKNEGKETSKKLKK